MPLPIPPIAYSTSEITDDLSIFHGATEHFVLTLRNNLLTAIISRDSRIEALEANLAEVTTERDNYASAAAQQ